MVLALQIMRILLPVLYGVCGLLYLRAFLQKHDTVHRAGPVLLVVSVVAHVGFFGALASTASRHPMGTVFEFLSFVALALASIYLVVESWHRNRHSGVFVIPFVFLLQVVASIGVEGDAELAPMLRESRIGMHTSMFAAAYAAFFLSMVYGVMLLLFHRAIRKKEFGLIFERLPSMDVLCSMTNRTALAGFVAMTAGIAMGIFNAAGNVDGFHMDPKIGWTAICWGLYGFMIFSHYVLKWTERRSAILSIAAFSCLLALTIVTNVFVSSWHQFTGQ